jgi:hypothetical protein
MTPAQITKISFSCSANRGRYKVFIGHPRSAVVIPFNFIEDRSSAMLYLRGRWNVITTFSRFCQMANLFGAQPLPGMRMRCGC